MNRLADESSLYLRQHAENPVDWYPWGEAALAAARERDVPILLSIGYSSCHWCHVMAHESFEDPATAALMNERFVNVKVDREERPDVDALYMQATVAMSGHGGWPMTVFLTPGGEPYYAGTYFPPAARGGMPAFSDLLRSLADAYANRREDVVFQAGRIRQALAAAARREPAGAIGPSLIADAMVGIGRAFDEAEGGFGGAPKFPPSLAIEFLLRRAWADPELGHAREMAELTLRRMAHGGIFDQVGGGFHRYAVDGIWLVPHFEKMLYDNALLARDYALAARVLDDPEFAAVATRVLDYMVRELRLPNGGFAAAQDADTPEGEGAFFTWTPEQLADVLDPVQATAAALRFGVTDAGNFENGGTVLHVAAPLEEVARQIGGPAEPVIATALAKLYAARRADRAVPARDDKVLTAWNGLAIAAFAEAGVALDRPDYLTVAADCAEFLLAELVVDGRLMRTHTDGRARHLGQLDDHANLCEGLLALYAADFDPRWPAAARALADRMIALFADPEGAGFLFAGSDGETLIAPVRDLEDQPTPSGNSQAARVLGRLAALTNDPTLAERATSALALVGAGAGRFPHAFGTALIAADALLGAPPEIAIIGEPGDPATAELVAVARAGAGPYAAIAAGAPGAGGDAVPLLADRPARDGRPTAYVCRGFACREAVTDPAALRAQLTGA